MTAAMDAWAGHRMGLGHSPSRVEINAYKLDRLNAIVAHARAASPFYRSRSDWPDDTRLDSLSDVARLPLTGTDDLARSSPTLIALPLRDAARLATVPTSGTTGRTKRVAFTEADLESTVDYFANGMATLVRPGQRVGVAFPSITPDSVGDLLIRGLSRLGAEPLALPVDGSIDDFIAALRSARPSAIAGMPVTLGAAARRSASDGGPPIDISTALVSADTPSHSLALALGSLWGCEIFEHWGMTEIGYGGALACEAHDGLHVRETDLLVEIIDPVTLAPLPNGSSGEIVVTTLTRMGQPFIRYRTGDHGAIVERQCRCGSRLQRIEHLRARAADDLVLEDGQRLSPEEINDAVFSVDGVIDFSVVFESGPVSRLRVDVASAVPGGVTADLRTSLSSHLKIAAALAGKSLVLEVRESEGAGWPIARKRRIQTMPIVEAAL